MSVYHFPYSNEVYGNHDERPFCVGMRDRRGVRTVMSQRRTLAFFLLASVFFGGTFVAAKAGQAYVPPILLVALRFDLAAVVLLAYAYYTSGEAFVPRTGGDLAGILAVGVLTIGLANGLLFVGQGYVSSAVGAIVFSLVPIFSPLFAALLLSDERLSAIGAVGTAVGLAGVAMVIGVSPGNLLAEINVGTLFILGGAISAALGNVLIRRWPSTISSTSRIAWGLPVSALMLHVTSVLAGESYASIEWTPAAIVSLLYLAVFAGAIAYVVFFALLEDVGAINSSLTFYASPAFAALGGWLFLGESITAVTVAGFGTIAVGFLIIGHEAIAPTLRRLAPSRSPSSVTIPGEQPDGGFECNGD